jgi:hypothetical protein
VACCARAALCDRCFTQALENLRGVAMSRGNAWADRVARDRPLDRVRAWPAHDGRAAAIARRLIQGLVGDPRLEGQLAAACAGEAARWWTKRWAI